MIQEFQNYLREIRGYSECTIMAYGKDLKEFARFMKSCDQKSRWSTITRDDIDKFISYGVNRGLKPSTTNQQVGAIKAFYYYLMRQGLMSSNPARYESRRKVAKTIPNTIPVEDIRRALEESTGTIHIILETLYLTGIRIQELLDLRKCDINVNNGRIRIQGKGMKERVVVTTPDNMRSLAKYSQYRQPTEPIFKEWTQREIRYAIWGLLKNKSTAKQLSPHAIRHTFATEVAKTGANVMTLASMMGHNDIRTTQKYIDMSQNNSASVFELYHQTLSH